MAPFIKIKAAAGARSILMWQLRNAVRCDEVLAWSGDLVIGMMVLVGVFVLVCVGCGLVLILRGLTQQDVATGYVLCIVPGGFLLPVIACNFYFTFRRPPTALPVVVVADEGGRANMRGSSSSLSSGGRGVFATMVYAIE